MRRLIFALFIIAVLGLAAYNAWRVSVLQSQVAGLEKEVAELKGDSPSSGSAEAISLITRARKHADRARKYIVDGEFERAKTELDKSLQLMRRFSESSEASARGTLEQMRRVWREAEESLERLLRESARKPKAESVKGG